MSGSDLPPILDDLATLTALTGPSWQEQDAVLSDMWRQNKTPQEIAEVLKRSVGAIMTRAARLGLPRRSAPGRKPGGRRLEDGTKAPLQRSQSSSARRSTSSNVGTIPGEYVPQPSTRVCLMCLRSFQSMGRHNRICPSCKGSSDYASAASTADIHFPV